MAPNMNYSQVVPDGPEDDWIGSRMGVLDTHGLITLLSSAELMAQSGGTYWTDSDTKALQNWVRKYRTWMETSRLGIAESKGLNNHGT
jgi:Alginate lyase